MLLARVATWLEAIIISRQASSMNFKQPFYRQHGVAALMCINALVSNPTMVKDLCFIQVKAQ